jgi:hypothetical protein
MNQYAIFASSTHAWLQSDDLTGKLSRAVRLANPSGIRLIRGWDEVLKFQKKNEKQREPSTESLPADTALKKLKNEVSDIEVAEAEDGDDEVSHLVFVIHGIGQKLGERIDAVNFAEGNLIHLSTML